MTISTLTEKVLNARFFSLSLRFPLPASLFDEDFIALFGHDGARCPAAGRHSSTDTE
jgi:hypothetical protein